MNREERLRLDGALDAEPLLFYYAEEEHGCLSQFSFHRVTLHDRWGRGLWTYDTGEHAFQARKMSTMDEHDKVAAQPTAGKAKWAGGPNGIGTMRDGWGNSYGDLCWYVMLEVCLGKAIQNVEVRDTLDGSLGRHIYEDSPIDDIWGWRFRNDYRGKNLLGRCWMETRELTTP